MRRTVDWRDTIVGIWARALSDNSNSLLSHPAETLQEIVVVQSELREGSPVDRLRSSANRSLQSQPEK